MKQLSLFDEVVLQNDCLEAMKSPRQAIYNIWLIRKPDGFWVKKESGGHSKKHVVQKWLFNTFSQAESFYRKKVKEKTNPSRKTRVYRLTSASGK